MPYPRWYARTPFLLTPKLQPGESDLFHCAKSLSIPEATDSAGDDLAGAVLFPEQGRNREEANHYGARDMKVADSRNARPIEQILA